MTIIHGDCLEIMKSIEDGSVDLVVTDPPYKIISGGRRKPPKEGMTDWSLSDPKGCLCRGNKRTDWVDGVRTGKMFNENEIKFSEWLPEVYRVLKERTHFYVMVNDKNIQDILNCSIEVGFKLVNILVWKKNNATPNRYYMKNCEFIVVFRKGKARNINYMGTKQCIEINNIIGTKVHPTEKPVELVKILIENSSKENDIVLDPFMGSGSTGVACKNLNRKFIGIEKDEEYFKKAKERIGE